jgi:hypothetical protein
MEFVLHFDKLNLYSFMETIAVFSSLLSGHILLVLCNIVLDNANINMQ